MEGKEVWMRGKREWMQDVQREARSARSLSEFLRSLIGNV